METRSQHLANMIDQMLVNQAIRSEYVQPFTEHSRRRMALIREYRRDACALASRLYGFRSDIPLPGLAG